MKRSGHGNGVAIALAALAVVIAGTGTAVAVSTTIVHIEDGSVAGRFAHVDQSGRLNTADAASTINIETIAQPNATYPLTDPTSATLAVTRLTFVNPQANASFANTNFTYQLVKQNVGSGGHCYDSDASIVATYSTSEVSPGDTQENVFPSPLSVRASVGKKYCLALTGFQYGGTASTYYTPRLELSAFILTGSYTGAGSAAKPSHTPTSRGLVRVAHTNH